MKLRGVRGYEPYWMPRTPEGTSRYNAQGSDSDVYQNKRSIPVETEFREVSRKVQKNHYISRGEQFLKKTAAQLETEVFDTTFFDTDTILILCRSEYSIPIQY